jgi:hypothetical protein
MWWGRKKTAEMLPWYRERSYKGGMTEAEKRTLDAFRMQSEHPAADSDDLPEEVQGYINGLEMAIYDLKQDKAANIALACSLAGAAWLYVNYFGLSAPTVWTYVFGALWLVVPLLAYRHQHNKNAEEFLPTKLEPGELITTDEGFRREWEANYIVGTRQRARHEREQEDDA